MESKNSQSMKEETMYNNDPMKVLTGKVRLSYCHLTTPRAPVNGGAPKYSATLLIPKTDTATKADIDQSIAAAVQDGVSKCWHGARPPQLRTPIHDGDGVRDNGESYGPECKGHWVITASCNEDRKPQVVHISNIRCELPPNEIYSGMYARVTIRFYPYDNSGNRGIGCGLGNVLKVEDGDPLGGGSTAEQDFAALEQPPVYAPQVAPYPQTPVAYPAQQPGGNNIFGM